MLFSSEIALKQREKRIFRPKIEGCQKKNGAVDVAKSIFHALEAVSDVFTISIFVVLWKNKNRSFEMTWKAWSATLTEHNEKTAQ